MNQKWRDKIDNLTYDQLLWKWRNSPSGDPDFQGEKGEYITERMKALRHIMTPTELSNASKKVGWE